MYVSHSECSAIAECGRRHHYSYIDRIVPNQTAPHLLHGSAAHLAVAEVHQLLATGTCWDDISDDDLIQFIYDGAMTVWTDPAGTISVPHVEDTVARLAPSMLLWHNSPDIANLYRACTVVDVEAIRFTPITEYGFDTGMEFKSVVDVVLRTPSGVVLLGEYKTWADMRAVDGLTTEDQYRRYLMAWPEAAGCWYIGIKRTGPKAKPDFAMRYMARTPAGQTKAVARLNHWAEQARFAHVNALKGEPPAPENPGYHCKDCDYRQLCDLTLEGRDDIAAAMKESSYHHTPPRGRPHRLHELEQPVPS